MKSYIIVIFLIVIITLIIFSKVKKRLYLLKKQKAKNYLHQNFGKTTSKNHINLEAVQRDWILISKNIPDKDKIDDITWFDLEMDQIYDEINNCQSFAGEQKLYSMLHTIGNHGTEYETLKDKIEFFNNEESERDEMWYIISCLGKETDSYYLPIYINNLEAFRIPNIDFFRFMRALLFLSFIPAIATINYVYLWFPVFAALANIVIYSIQKNRYEAYLNMLRSVLRIMEAAQQIVNSTELKYENKFKDLSEKIHVFQKLLLIIGKLQYRFKSSISGDAMTLAESATFGITLWDLIQYDKVIKQLIGHQKELRALYEIIGQIDAAISVASFRKSLPFYCVPQFDNKSVIEVKEVFHPFVKNPVYNSVTINKGCIITGANASGKSTFIKILAINAILGQSINTCIARGFKMPHCAVVTSMAVRDQVASGESYYIKEIKYLKRIISLLNSDTIVFSVIDEILRGTNTNERIAASVSILKYLYEKNSITVVATHDMKLTKMLNGYFDCFHFKEHISEKKMSFEYKIYPGPATSTNALRLLEYMEFPGKIIEEAEKISSGLCE
ncbi:hypothetical protein [Lacrimispora sp.]|uniref:MutS-related protein n=1 Tax=Lacrimispora sp. TaxID=2719234 RepID=UPI00345F3B46